MNLDWHRLKAVVLESDDWGLCAWAPDAQACGVLSGLPAFRSAPGLRYGRSTLESAADVEALADLLLEFRGADEVPPVWQANTIVAAPDWERLAPPFDFESLPLTGVESLTGRWRRPGLTAAWAAATERGVWWAELHGLHHLPEIAWRDALRRGDADALAALAQQSFVCAAVEASGEYDASEPRDVRARLLREAVARFTALFGRAPTSFCPPDYRFDAWLEREAASLGLTTLQGVAERAGGRFAALRRRVFPPRFPALQAGRFHLPPRIAFEPRGDAAATGRVGVAAALGHARRAWARGAPAVVSTHRLNYAHLDPAWSAAGRTALRALLGALCAEGAAFFVDAELRALAEGGRCVRPLGHAAALMRNPGGATEPLRWPAPHGVAAARCTTLAGAPSAAADAVKVAGGMAEARVGPGTHRIEWVRT